MESAYVRANYVRSSEAAEIIGVSRVTFWRLVTDGKIAQHTSVRDRRERLYLRREVEALRDAVMPFQREEHDHGAQRVQHDAT